MISTQKKKSVILNAMIMEILYQFAALMIHFSIYNGYKRTYVSYYHKISIMFTYIIVLESLYFSGSSFPFVKFLNISVLIKYW